MCIYIVLFGSNSPKISVLFYVNSEKKSVLFGSVPLKVLVLFDMNSDKRFLILFCIRSLQMSELFHMNSKIIALLVFKSCLVCERFERLFWKTIFYFLFLKNTWHSICWIDKGCVPCGPFEFLLFTQDYFCLKSFLLLDFAFCLFVWLIKFKYVSHPSHDYDCFRGSYVILRG